VVGGVRMWRRKGRGGGRMRRGRATEKEESVFMLKRGERREDVERRGGWREGE